MTPQHLFHPQISIVGLGKVGRNLARYFHQRGITIAASISHSAHTLDIPTTVHSNRLQDIPKSTDWIFLCLPESQIAATANELSMCDLKKDITIAHTSGIASSQSLNALADVTSTIGSFHPIQAFDRINMELHYLNGITCGIEGTTAFIGQAKSLCETLGWKPLVIEKENKALYHASCVFAGNFVSEILSVATHLFKRATNESHPEAALLPMLKKILEQLENEGSITITGPASRRDHQVIHQHIESLESVDRNFSILYNAISESIITATERDKQ